MAKTITLHFCSIMRGSGIFAFFNDKITLKYMCPMGIASIGRLQRGREGISL